MCPGTPIPQSPRIRKVSALSDFAPINLKVRGYSYHSCVPITLLTPAKEDEGRYVPGTQVGLVVPHCDPLRWHNALFRLF